MYNKTLWKDRVVDSQTGEVIQQGTEQSAGHFNNMETGIDDNHIAGNVRSIILGNLMQRTEIERITVNLTSNENYPFTNSDQTVSLAVTRNNTDYTVDADVQAHSGNVGDIHIFDKQTNGFKVKYDGSAKSATIILKVQGGI